MHSQPHAIMNNAMQCNAMQCASLPKSDEFAGAKVATSFWVARKQTVLLGLGRFVNCKNEFVMREKVQLGFKMEMDSP